MATKKTKISPRQQRLKQWYFYGSAALLALTTGFWGAKLQQSNADQLINSYLVESSQTFQQANLPGQHTFLLKWPLFALIKTLHGSGAAYIGMTIFLCLLTVGALAYVMYRIERRPLVIGTLYLALASVLLMIPAQPYNGALLPVNMAMITTRNLEYILYIGALIVLYRWHEVKSWGFWAGVGLLALLVSSDKLFLYLSLGGALFALMTYVFTKRWKLAQVSIKWLTATVFAMISTFVILFTINKSGLTNVTTVATTDGYGLTHNVANLVKASIYGGLGFITNFGANPAFDGLILREIPAVAAKRIFSPSGFGLIVNFVIMLTAIYFSGRLLLQSIIKRTTNLNRASALSLMLIWSTIAAFGAFILTKHYYVTDARYLTISLFAGFVGLATAVRQINWKPRLLWSVGGVLLLSLVSGLFFTLTTYRSQTQALKPTNDRNSLVAQALQYHQVDYLVGDYWRVVPTKETAKEAINIMPLANCLQPRQELSSAHWQPDLKKHSFAYLLSLDPSLTDYPGCSLETVVGAYGRPNASAVIAGTNDKPQELLLFYDNGAQQPPANPTRQPATALPIPIEELPNTSCQGATIMNVVAHEDDDLIFMNPDVQTDITAGRCVRTVYVTAGDAGSNEFYWLSREKGSQAAYSHMIGLSKDTVWVQRIIKLADKLYINVANPRGNPNISLIFLRLPDGNLKGQGFNGSHFESLANLEAGKIKQITTVTKQSVFTADQLVSSLSTLMSTYHPAEIRTQSSVAGSKVNDHSDHGATGRFAQKAYVQYEQRQFEDKVKIPFKYYLGYPGKEQPANLSGKLLDAKRATFFTYAKYDGNVCQNVDQCAHKSTLGDYLERQYTASH